MARPPIPIGAHGEIKITPVTLKNGRVLHVARCRFRAADGSLTKMSRTRKTGPKAEAALKEAVVNAADEIKSGDIKPSTRLKVVAEAWFAEFDLAVSEGRKQPKTRDIYRTYLDLHILPAMGELRMVEVDTVRCEALMTAKRKAGAKDDKLAGIRNVLSGICGYAVRHGALKTNPVRELSRLQRTGRPKPRALTAAERKDVLAKLDVDERAIQYELADVLRGMLATGVRVSEMLGCSGDDVLLDGKPALMVHHRTIRIKGQGITRRRRTDDSKGDEQKLWIPTWSVPMFRARKLASGGNGPLFPDKFGGWRSNDSVTKPLRDALDRAGYEWLTSHGMRDTVANVLKAAGIPVRQIADQLGQRSTAVTERHYLEVSASNDAQVEALEGMMELREKAE